MTSVKVGGTLSVDRPDEDAVTRILQDDFDLLQLVNGGVVWHDLQFLSPCKQKIRRLRTSGIFDGFRGLETLTDLVHLNLEDYSPDPVFDFSPLAKLEFCKMGWSPKIVGKAFFSIPNLREVSLLKYKGHDCAEIGLAKKLRCLELRRGMLESLDGIAGCSSMEELRLFQVKGLSSLAGIEKCRSLKVIEVEKGSVLTNVAQSLRQCSALTEVLLDGGFELADLGWIKANSGMTRFRSDAIVLDVDWHALFGATKLLEISFRYAPHALQSDDEIKAIAATYGRHVQWIEHGGTKRSLWLEVHFR